MVKKSESLPKGTLVPNHIAIICDGNRRWARARGLPYFKGHQRGFDITPAIARACRSFGVHTLTYWAFSTENWDRSKEEIAFLMKKFEEFVERNLQEAKKDNVRIVHLGRKDRIPLTLAKKITQAEDETKNNSRYLLNIALDYGGRDEILRATKRMLKESVRPEEVDEKLYCGYLDTHDQLYPYPDLLIRPSGEQRTSGMFVWQGAYTETYWLTDHFPAFTTEILKEAILDYSKRRRRFGTNDSVPKVKFDPKEIAKLELGWWKAHNDGDKKRLSFFLVKWSAKLYDVGDRSARKIVEILSTAVKCHNERSWQKAIEVLTEAYEMIKGKTKYVFSPAIVAQLEVNWWRIHDELENDLNKEILEKAFRDYYGEIYRLSELQAIKTAHWKTLATVAHDLAEKSKSKGDEDKYWRLTEDYLVKVYQALREVAS